MSAPNPLSVASSKSAYAALARHRGHDAPETLDARRDLAAAVIEKRVHEIVDAAPPLTDEQKSRIVAALGGAR